MYNNRRKIIIGLIIGVALLVIVSIFSSFATTQEVTIITSDSEATIAIQGTDGSNPRELGQGTATVRLAPGDYAVRAMAAGKETRTLVTVKAGEPKTVKLTLAEARQPEKIGTIPAHKPIATNTGLQYLNTAFGQIETYLLATRENIPLAPEAYNLVDIFWANPSSAYVLDENGVYSHFNGTSVTPLDITETFQIATNPTGAFAAVENNKVDVRTAPNTEPIYAIDINAHEPRLAFGAKNRLLVYDTIIATETDAVAAQPVAYEGRNKISKATDAMKDLVISGASWSPDASRLAIATQQGMYVLEVNSGQLTRLSVLSTPHAESFTWLNNTTGLYFADQVIWRINVTTQTWEKLAQTSESVPTNNPFAIAPKGDNAYFVTDVADGSELSGNIYILNLR